MTTFYDTVGMAALCREARHQHYPPTVLSMAMLQYMALRVLKVGCTLSLEVRPCTGMIAGCGKANNMARAALHRAAEAITSRQAAAFALRRPGLLDHFVDDLLYFSAQASVLDLAQDINECTGALLDFLLGDCYVISDKSAIVSSTLTAARAAQGAARCRGVRLHHKTVGEDLGIDLSSSRRRRVPKVVTRARKAIARNTKVIKLRVKHVQRKLFSSAIMASQGYHVRVQGMPPSVLRKSRSQLAKHLGAKARWCSHTIIAVEAASSDPEIRFKLEAVKQHFETWTTLPEMRDGIAVAWQKNEDWLARTPRNKLWYFIQRPLCATQAVVQGEGWYTPQPDLWVDHEGTKWFFPDTFEESPTFFQWWARHQRLNQWQRASGSWLAGGSEQGACVQIVKQHVRRLRCSGKAREAQLALCIACGGLWTGARVKAAGLSMNDKCQLCGDIDDELHRSWGGCPVIAAAALPEVERTKHLEVRAREQAQIFPCLWLRALTPESLMPHIPSPHIETVVCTHGIFEGMDVTVPGAFSCDGLVFYVDESGGEFASDPLLRRCGAGAAAMLKADGHAADPLNLLGAIAATLPGDFQTPARACLHMVLMLLTFAYGSLDLRLDCKLVVDGLTWQDRPKRPQGVHGDLWRAIGRALGKRIGAVVVHKVKAHCTDEQFVQGTVSDDVDFAGNHYSDRLAAAAAELHCLPYDVTQSVAFLRGRTALILQRLVATNLFYLENSEKRITTDRPPRDPLAATGLQRRAESSGHLFSCVPRFLKLLPSSLHCRRCKQVVLKTHLKQFVASHCPGPPAAAAIGFSRPRCFRVRRADLHSSHAVLLYRGLWFCTTCGAYTAGADARGMVRKLGKPCRPRTEGGRLRLRRLAQGKHPDLKAWPESTSLDQQPAHSDDLPPLVPCVRLRSKTTLVAGALAAEDLRREIEPCLSRGRRGGIDDPEADELWDDFDDPGVPQ